MSGGGPGKAAGIGAIGCLATFIVIGLIVAATGGVVYADAGGVMVLLVIGAVLGLIVWVIYDKGRRDAPGDPWARPGSSGAPRPGVDELIEEIERDHREGRIDREEYERRRRRAWGHPE